MRRSQGRLSAGDEDPVARYRAQERGRRRARQHHHQGRGVLGVSRAARQRAQRHRPNAAIQGVLVGPMAKKGVEIIIGTMLDATFGPMVMVGLGGITTELFRDVDLSPGAGQRGGGGAMLGELKAAPLLQRLPRCGEGGCCGAVKTDLGGIRARGAAEAIRCRGDRAQSGAGASGRAGRDDRGCAGGAEEVERAAIAPSPLVGRGWHREADDGRGLIPEDPCRRGLSRHLLPQGEKEKGAKLTAP